jgi:hypothetical protein
MKRQQQQEGEAAAAAGAQHRMHWIRNNFSKNSDFLSESFEKSRFALLYFSSPASASHLVLFSLSHASFDCVNKE